MGQILSGTSMNGSHFDWCQGVGLFPSISPLAVAPHGIIASGLWTLVSRFSGTGLGCCSERRKAENIGGATLLPEHLNLEGLVQALLSLWQIVEESNHRQTHALNFAHAKRDGIGGQGHLV